MIGKINKKIDNDFGYITDEEGNQYLFSVNDILDDTEIIVGTEVYFKPEEDKIFKATYISKIEVE